MAVLCVLPPLQPWGSLGTGSPCFTRPVRMLHAAMEPCYPPVQELIPIHSSHSFLFPFPALWLSNVIPKQLKLLEIIFLE